MLLLLDNFVSHKIYSFWKLAIDVKIILFKLFTYSTHLLQSLDIDIFRLFKQYYSNKINRFIYVDNIDFTKLDFLNIFKSFRAHAFIKKIIVYIWKHIDIIFYNSIVVLKSIKRKNVEEFARRASIVSSKTSIALNNKNNTLKRISRDSKLYYKYIEVICNNIVLYNKLEQIYIYRQLFRFLQELITQLNILFLYIRNLNKATKIFATKTQ